MKKYLSTIIFLLLGIAFYYFAFRWFGWKLVIILILDKLSTGYYIFNKIKKLIY